MKSAKILPPKLSAREINLHARSLVITARILPHLPRISAFFQVRDTLKSINNFRDNCIEI